MREWALLRNSLREYLRVKSLAAAVFLVLLAPALGLIWKAASSQVRYNPETAYNFLASFLVFGYTLTLLSVIYTTGIISREIEQKTIVFLLTRPIARWRIALTRLVGGLIATCVTTWLSSILLAIAIYGFDGLGKSRLWQDLSCIPLGAASYGCLFLMLGTIFDRPLVLGLLFAFGWESWVPMFTGAYKRLSIMTYLRVLAPHPSPDVAGTPQNSVDVFAMLNPSTISGTEAWIVLLVLTTVTLSVALMVFSRREYVPKEDAE